MVSVTGGVFVGGKARRMGGVAKGLLAHPTASGTIIDHIERQLCLIGANVVLVGTHTSYEGRGLEMVEDAVSGVGPAGGLLALLRREGNGIALALACDMPFIQASLLRQLVEGVEAGAPAVVPRRGHFLEPLCAAYRADVVAKHVERSLARGICGLHRIVRAAGAVELVLEDNRKQLLNDWDSREDIEQSCQRFHP